MQSRRCFQPRCIRVMRWFRECRLSFPKACFVCSMCGKRGRSSSSWEATQKKRKLGEGLFTEEADTEEAYATDCETYLKKLRTLLIAYALAGSRANSTEFVEVPLDVMLQLQYYLRAKKATSTLPMIKRLGWLQARDEERSECVAKLGKVPGLWAPYCQGPNWSPEMRAGSHTWCRMAGHLR